jgi:hypothetical protein
VIFIYTLSCKNNSSTLQYWNKQKEDYPSGLFLDDISKCEKKCFSLAVYEKKIDVSFDKNFESLSDLVGFIKKKF